MNAKFFSLLAMAVATPFLALAQAPQRFSAQAGVNNVVSPPDGLMVFNGALYKVQNGFAVVVAGNGIVKGVDGNPVRIPPGAMYTTDGRLIPIPPGIAGVPPGVNARTPVRGNFRGQGTNGTNGVSPRRR